MLAKAAAVLAIAGSAAAYVPAPMALRMSSTEGMMSPFKGANPANAALSSLGERDGVSSGGGGGSGAFKAKAPVITIFDHRGCSRAPKEYKGKSAGGEDDEMMVKVQSVKIAAEPSTADAVLNEALNLMDGKFSSQWFNSKGI
mmetsp:Transcript_92756/g.139162  ORF Transcript_92756/g.139162 Transcript_92756/m.139162 type:complete len:143 (+) Transcript_92756:32-460(+)|eukprot:2694841-Rhodomonas_salina.2